MIKGDAYGVSLYHLPYVNDEQMALYKKVPPPTDVFAT
jgi:hypothetical protein